LSAVISTVSHLFPVNSSSGVWYDMVRYTLEQRIFLRDTYVKYGSAGKYRRKFHDERVPIRQFVIWWINLEQRDS
jgi:hypothetical protein